MQRQHRMNIDVRSTTGSPRKFREFKVCLFLALMISVASCDEIFTDLERGLDEVAPSEIIDVHRVGASDLPADSATFDTIVARIPAEASVRVVKFTTTLGTFVGSLDGPQVEVLAVPSNGALEARATLMTGTKAGNAIVRGQIKEFADTVIVVFSTAPGG